MEKIACKIVRRTTIIGLKLGRSENQSTNNRFRKHDAVTVKA